MKLIQLFENTDNLKSYYGIWNKDLHEKTLYVHNAKCLCAVALTNAHSIHWLDPESEDMTNAEMEQYPNTAAKFQHTDNPSSKLHFDLFDLLEAGFDIMRKARLASEYSPEEDYHEKMMHWFDETKEIFDRYNQEHNTSYDFTGNMTIRSWNVTVAKILEALEDNNSGDIRSKVFVAGKDGVELYRLPVSVSTVTPRPRLTHRGWMEKLQNELHLSVLLTVAARQQMHDHPNGVLVYVPKRPWLLYIYKLPTEGYVCVDRIGREWSFSKETLEYITDANPDYHFFDWGSNRFPIDTVLELLDNYFHRTHHAIEDDQ